MNIITMHHYYYFTYTVINIGFTNDSYEGYEGNGYVTIELGIQEGVNLHVDIFIRVTSENIENTANTANTTNAATCKYNGDVC